MVDVGSILLTCCIHCFILIWLVLVVLAGSLHQCISWNSDSSNAHFWRDHVTWWCCPWCSGWRCQWDGQWRGWHQDPPRWWPTSWTSPPQWEWSWPCRPVRRHRCGLLWILTKFYIIVTIFLLVSVHLALWLMQKLAKLVCQKLPMQLSLYLNLFPWIIKSKNLGHHYVSKYTLLILVALSAVSANT